MKYFRMSYEEVVFERSYLNILLLNRSIPSMNLDNDDYPKSGRGHPKPKKTRPVANNQKFRHESELFASMM